MRWLPVFCISCCIFAAHAAQAGETAYTVRATEVKARPFSDADTLSSLPKNSPVEVLERKASWTRIKSDGTTGWVKMLGLRFGDAARKKSGDSGLGALFNVAATGGSGSTVSTGVRGLSEENLKNPHPNPQAMKELQRYATGKREAQGFGKSGKLATRQIDYLPPAK